MLPDESIIRTESYRGLRSQNQRFIARRYQLTEFAGPSLSPEMAGFPHPTSFLRQPLAIEAEHRWMLPQPLQKAGFTVATLTSLFH